MLGNRVWATFAFFFAGSSASLKNHRCILLVLLLIHCNYENMLVILYRAVLPMLNHSLSICPFEYIFIAFYQFLIDLFYILL